MKIFLAENYKDQKRYTLLSFLFKKYLILEYAQKKVVKVMWLPLPARETEKSSFYSWTYCQPNKISLLLKKNERLDTEWVTSRVCHRS